MICTAAIEAIPQHVHFLVGKARRLCRNEADARDLVQDVCLLALEALQQAEHPPDNLCGWLVVIMRNHWYSQMRQRRVRSAAQAELSTTATLDAGLHETRLVLSQLERAWSRLSPQSQRIALECLVDGESQEEVSRRLGMTAGGVAASIHRTRAALRQSMFGVNA